MSRRLVVLMSAMACSVCAPCDRACAFSYYTFGTTPIVWPGATATRYLSPSVFPEGSDTEQLYLSAMGLWEIVPGASFDFVALRNDQDYPIDNFDGFSDTTAVDPSQLDPGTLGITYLVNNNAAWHDTDMVFNANPDGVGWNFETNPSCDVVAAPTPTNGYSFFLVATHELGHALGLGHDPMGDEPPGFLWNIATMNPGYPTGGPVGQDNIIEVHADDRAGLRFLYPGTGVTQRDLAAAMFSSSTVTGLSIPIAAVPNVALPGESISVVSVIENFGTSSHLQVIQRFYMSDDPVIEETDEDIGFLEWDMAPGAVLEFVVEVQLDDDLASGPRWFGSIIDDGNAIAELYEDNNAAVICTPLTIEQFGPEIEPIQQQYASEGVAWSSPLPVLTHPLNMAPIMWQLDVGPPGMTIDPGTGQVSWAAPVASEFLYAVTIRATNAAGSSTQLFFLAVDTCHDVTGDGVIDLHDLTQVLFEFGQPAIPPGTGADTDGSGVVDLTDLQNVLFNFGLPCH